MFCFCNFMIDEKIGSLRDQETRSLTRNQISDKRHPLHSLEGEEQSNMRLFASETLLARSESTEMRSLIEYLDWSQCWFMKSRSNSKRPLMIMFRRRTDTYSWVRDSTVKILSCARKTADVFAAMADHHATAVTKYHTCLRLGLHDSSDILFVFLLWRTIREGNISNMLCKTIVSHLYTSHYRRERQMTSQNTAPATRHEESWTSISCVTNCTEFLLHRSLYC